MNNDEKIAEAYLKKNYSNVVYEPDGNVPPDFSVNGTIGVEVRRLNQQHRNNGSAKGLEEQSIPLKSAIETELSKYPKDCKGNNYWLALRYERDIGKLKEIKKNVQLAIQAFQNQNESIPFKYNLSDRVVLEFIAKASNLSQKYKMGLDLDQDSGGWIVNLYVQDTMHCIKEKEKKIELYKSKYKSWWLLLIDHINFMDSSDRADIIKGISLSSSFDRVIVVKHDGTAQFEV